MRITAILCSLLLVFALPLVAQESSVANPAPQGTANCEPAGTWFGGSQPFNPYMMTISAGNGGRYTVDWQLIVPAVPFEGYLGISHWSGELVRIDPGRYEAWAILYAVYDPVLAEEYGIDPSLPELDYVHGYLEFSDCNTMTNVIDVYNWYVNFDHTKGMVPFVTEPDVVVLEDGATIDEVYYRMPTKGPTLTHGSPGMSFNGVSNFGRPPVNSVVPGTRFMIKR